MFVDAPPSLGEIEENFVTLGRNVSISIPVNWRGGQGAGLGEGGAPRGVASGRRGSKGRGFGEAGLRWAGLRSPSSRSTGRGTWLRGRGFSRGCGWASRRGFWRAGLLGAWSQGAGLVLPSIRGSPGAPPDHGGRAAAAVAAAAAAGGGGGPGGLWGLGGARGAPWGGALHLLHPQGALHLARLARGHGPVLHVRGGGRDVLVLSSVGTIREALARNWGVWMGRPPSYLGSLVSRGGQDLALGGGSPGWRFQRAAARGALGRAGGRLRPLLSHQAALLCQELRSHGGAPLDPFEIFAFHTCSTIGRLLFGDLLPPEGEVRSFARCLVELLDVWGRGSVQALDLLPLLRVLPNPGLRELLRLVQKRDAFVEAQIRRHQEHPSPPSDTVLGALCGGDPGVRGAPLGPARLHMTLVDLFIGGTETTAAALGWAVAFLLHRPELQARLRAELSGVLGAAGTPGPGDAPRLPLLQAVVSETLRLRPPAPLGLPHRAQRRTSVGGVAVPAGSILVPNLLAAQTDPGTWSHPDAFLPERFLAPGAPVRALLPFGCGARACPGEALARAELLVFLGRILRDFRLEPPAPGQLPRLGVRGGTVLRCPPFRVRLTPLGPPDPRDPL